MTEVTAPEPTAAKNDRFSRGQLIVMTLIAVGITWLAAYYWLELFADPRAEAYLPGKHGGGFIPVILAVCLTTPPALLLSWFALLTLKPLVKNRHRFDGITFTAVAVVQSALIIVGSVALAAPETTAVVAAIVGPFAAVMLFGLIGFARNRARGVAK